MSNDNKEFPRGIIFKLPNEKAPDFVKGSLSIKRKELIEYLQSKNDEWLNYDLKVSKNGKAYIDINDWKPNTNVAVTQQAVSESDQRTQESNEIGNQLPF